MQDRRPQLFRKVVLLGMKVIQLPDDLYQFLLVVQQRHAANGIDPAEGLAVYHLWEFTKKAQHIDDAALQAQAAEREPEISEELPPLT
jgi:hypothetical protein